VVERGGSLDLIGTELKGRLDLIGILDEIDPDPLSRVGRLCAGEPQQGFKPNGSLRQRRPLVQGVKAHHRQSGEEQKQRHSQEELDQGITPPPAPQLILS
jgi:hypothetical protein